MKQFGPPPYLGEPHFQLTPLFLSNFFVNPPYLSKFQKREPPLILEERKL